MRTTITRDQRFEAAHRLPHVPPDHKCARIHGHSYRVTLTLGGDVDDRLGWIVDFAEIDRAWQPLHALLDHRYLNEVEGLENPTAELIARFIAERFNPPVGRLLSVTVHETCAGACTIHLDD